ncbi:MAG TPA: hypothetical protein PK325_07505 [Cyclobacteriaceae bacterium]|nr:hypothetical protein [Cyclobacteriaceae bacterium]HMV10432.1 hypothetical protein [Cyclobacteriaceae bacterium]HMX01355.1 hypothetical protein [Cyclobacteriaceae bacterium]HMX50374.1 hypothetical protein [Cyclobacteriaceae bacterium]HMY92443.1 hypothetical protein [Cyclobacteriaceae bacterium]
MAKHFISKLQIEGFRGINNENDPLEINLKNDQVNSLFASNAQGKSSIFDALCFAIKGTVPKLALLQQSERAENYYANQFHSSGLATIILTLQPDDGSAALTVRVRRQPDGLRVVDSPSGFTTPEQLLNSLNSEFCLLDYRSFQEFIEETPLKRGRAFSSLLGLGKISGYRQALEVLSNTRNLNTDFDLLVLRERVTNYERRKSQLESLIITNYHKLTNVQVTSPIDTDQIISESTNALKNITILRSTFETHTLMTADFDAIKAIIKNAEKGSEQERLRQLIQIIPQLESLKVESSEEEEREGLKELVEQLNKNLSGTSGPLTKKHYEETLKLMSSAEWTNDQMCPTCETTLTSSLPESLKKKLLQYQRTAELHEKLNEAWSNSQTSSRLDDLLVASQIAIDHKDRKRIKEIAGLIEAGTISAENLQEIIDYRTNLDGIRLKTITNLKAEQEKLQKGLPPSLVALTEQVAVAEDLKKQITDYLTSVRNLNDASDKLSKRTKWVEFITNASHLFATAEVALSTSKTLSLETSYRALYQAITNNPDVIPKLVKTGASEDLLLNLDTFYGKSNLAASALLSESYRNALALSIFLSAAIQNSESSFIVFDDVTSSFDAGHQFALMEVLRTQISRPNNTNGPQVIVLSHDGLLEKYFDKVSSTALWHHQRLNGLAPNGKIFTQTQNANRLKGSATQFLQAGQIDQAEPLVRQYLEFKLLEIIHRVNIPVPIDFSIRDDRKMVQNCINAITAALDLYSRANQLILSQSQQTSAKNTLIPSIVANWLSHYSTGVTASFTPQLLLAVLSSIDQIADCFMYNCTCSGSVQRKYYKSLSSKHCRCI